MKKTLTTLTVATAIGLAAPAFAAEKVAIGVPSWTGAQATAQGIVAQPGGHPGACGVAHQVGVEI